MINSNLRGKLSQASSLEDVKSILKGHPAPDAKRVWAEIENHRSLRSEKLDLDELDAVSGGADRDWVKDGCAATCEFSSWCWSNDRCLSFDITYDSFWVKCPDGHDHIFSNLTCTRCGFVEPYEGYCDDDD